MFILMLQVSLAMSNSPVPASQKTARKPAGLYAIWYNKAQADLFLGQPYIRGGQIVLQWADVEPEQGKYDFSVIDEQLRAFKYRQQLATLQINGNRKPQWLFEKVPYHRQKLSVQVNDTKGTLMYWHPVHRDAYLGMLKALAKHLRSYSNRDAILGIRMNLNAVGTEHHNVADPYRSLEQWVIPPDVERAELVEWNRDVDDRYIKAVIDNYISGFKGVVKIFVRNGIDEKLLAAYRKDFENGTLSWFHTSSEAEPRAGFAERKYRRFYDYCRSGKTDSYAEPWASAWGHHGPKQDDRWCSPPQWNYWRLLLDLHCGVSYIALYSSDMLVGINGRYMYRQAIIHQDDRNREYKQEFDAAFRFAARYAGFHARPETSPGAWIAFRENNVVRAANGIPEKWRRLEFFNTDYTFLMRRLPGDRTKGRDIVNIGPDEQRYGAWARLLPAGESVSLAIDEMFVAGLAGSDVKIKIVFLDDSDGAFDVIFNEKTHRHRMTGSGRWQIAGLTVPGGLLAKKHQSGAHIVIRSGTMPVYFHMVELQRPDGTGDGETK